MNQGISTEQNLLANQNIDYFKVLKILWSRWYWIAGCVITALLITYLYLWYTPPVYSTNASLKFDEKKSEISELLKVNNVYDRTNKVQSETFVIKSTEVLMNAVSRLNYKISYYLKGRIRTTETYPSIPFPIEIVSQDTTNFYHGLLDIQNSENNEFKLTYLDGKNVIKHSYHYGDIIHIPGIVFQIKENLGAKNSDYSFKFNTKEDFISRISSGLSMREAAKSSNILILTYTDPNPVFAKDILNAIIREYVSFDGNQRSLSASQTIQFIEDQLKFLSTQVTRSGSALQEFKRDNKLIDLNTNTQLSLNKLTQAQTQKNILEIEGLAIDQLEQQIINNRDGVNLNFNLEGTVGGLLSNLITQLNALIAEREKKLSQFNPDSPPVIQTENQIVEIRKAIINNIKLMRERNQKTQHYTENQISQAQQGLNSLPIAERDLINLQSVFDINQKVFSYLSEKKLEAQISKAAVIPGAIIVNLAENGSIISPVPNKIYTYGIFLGVLTGLGLIILVRILNPYIYDKETVESLTTMPILGVIRHFPGYIDKDNHQILSLEKPKSMFSESVRSVRTNLSFLADEKQSKVICITSEISGEGKSFVCINLVSTLALIDKKVILISADLRKSKLHQTFNLKNNDGLSTYLSSPEKDINTIIQHTHIDNLDFIASGSVPPNPSELLHSDAMNKLIEELKDMYDFIMIDTAPIGLVSDAIPLIRKADINVFVIRSGISRYNAATIPDRMAHEYGLTNVVIVLNSFDDDILHSRYYSTNYATSYYNNYYYYSDYSGYSNSGYYDLDGAKSSWWKFWEKFKR